MYANGLGHIIVTETMRTKCGRFVGDREMDGTVHVLPMIMIEEITCKKCFKFIDDFVSGLSDDDIVQPQDVVVPETSAET
jgi:hypothetical protein